MPSLRTDRPHPRTPCRALRRYTLAATWMVPIVCGAVPLAAQDRPGRDAGDRATLEAVLADVEREAREDILTERLDQHLPVERLPDLSHAGAVRRGARAAAHLRRLERVRESALTAEEQLTLRMIRWDLAIAAEAPTYHWLSFANYTPYGSGFSGSALPAVRRAFAEAPLGTAAERARFDRLLASLPAWLDDLRGGLEARAERGIRISRQEIPAVVALMRTYARDADRSPFVPALARLSALPVADAAAFRARAAAVVTTRVNPAIERIATYLEGPYRQAAPEGVGLAQYPGGRAYYRYLVRRETTTELTPREIHDIGLREVARLDAEMAAIRAAVGFRGTSEEFHAQLRADRRFYATTPDEVRARYMGHIARIEPVIDRYFARRPRARGDAQRLAPELEPTMTYGYYQVPTPTDSMGHYLFNGSRLAERSQINSAAVIYHELVPGHHFQFNLQRENAELPPYRRRTFLNAFLEGWGEYSSTLAGEMGMYEDPYDRYGKLFLEMFLTTRLVVDTGMNEFGWTRDSAMAFMRPRVAESEAQLETETLRYSTDIPAQALGYKVGALEILRLREEARRSMGPRFDIRAFHDVVLGSGTLPLAVLAWKVKRWAE